MADDLGVIAAALTPRGKRGDLDFGAAFELIDLLCSAKLAGVAFFTAAGEYPAFSVDERTRLVYLAAKRSRIPVYAGIGAMSLEASLNLARDAMRAGAAGVLLPPPHFYTYSQEELKGFYLQFAAHASRGSAIYIANTPSVTTPVETATALDLLATGRFAGIEDTGTDGAFAGKTYAWLADDERRSAAGANGVVSAAASVAPELVRSLNCALRTGNRAEAERLDALLQEFRAWTRRFAQPIALKVAAELRGLKVGGLPVPVSGERQPVLDEFREWLRVWLPKVTKLTANV
jgi:4-hydroxy-tetrahydrodipicolinate synthase